jgi:uncharacterized membrane protein YhaH (DUF805 family)
MPASGAPGANDLSLWGYFMRCMTSKYATFSGRARRKEFWSLQLFSMLILVGLAIVAAALAGSMQGASEEQTSVAAVILVLLFGVLVFASIIPNLAVFVRRLHDLGMSAGWVLVMLIPSIGTIFMLVIGCIPGQDRDNDYGPSPLG